MSVAHWQGLRVLPGALGTLLSVSCACGHWPGQTGHRELVALPCAELLELRVLGPICTVSGRPSAGRSFCLCKFLLPPTPMLLHDAFSRCLFSCLLARIDMIVGPPPPSTPRHKKYPSKGPTAPPRESPQYSPRSGHAPPVFVECQSPSLQPHDGSTLSARQDVGLFLSLTKRRPLKPREAGSGALELLLLAGSWGGCVTSV